MAGVRTDLAGRFLRAGVRAGFSAGFLGARVRRAFTGGCELLGASVWAGLTGGSKNSRGLTDGSFCATGTGRLSPCT